MKESDYLNVSNLAKVRAATGILVDVLIMSDISEENHQLRRIIKECRSLEFSLRIPCAITEEG
tara:strand:- start:275 stop:463 length:189 start_codon:yes stop_codon:yes gene_type:complete